ncbi:MAG: hypothetical protein KDJ52_09165 [Anaerolineae bacterium]|nr:hypothetical protein [Anaerolineae bacterium]
MATLAKTINGTVTKDRLTDITAKAQQETEAVVQTMLGAADKFNENGQAILDVQEKLIKGNFNLWKKWSQFYINFSVDATQQTVEQLLSLRERLGIIAENELKRMYELLTSEQELTLDAAEVFQAQVKAASDQMTEIFTPPSAN